MMARTSPQFPGSLHMASRFSKSLLFNSGTIFKWLPLRSEDVNQHPGSSRCGTLTTFLFAAFHLRLMQLDRNMQCIKIERGLVVMNVSCIIGRQHHPNSTQKSPFAMQSLKYCCNSVVSQLQGSAMNVISTTLLCDYMKKISTIQGFLLHKSCSL